MENTMMWFDLRLKTPAQVRWFTLVITAVVLVVSTAWNFLYMPPEVFRETLVPGSAIAAFLSLSLAYYVGCKMRVVEELTRQLEHSANHDHLTGVSTRKRFFQTCAEGGEVLFPGVLMIVDIDHFKLVNDTFGHKAGDVALKHFAGVLRRNCRETDLVARFGGEEFVILLASTTPEQGLGVAERLRQRVEAHAIETETEQFSITASFGVAGVRGRQDLDRAIQEADNALYVAKRDGRNRVSRFTPRAGVNIDETEWPEEVAAPRVAQA